MPIGVSERGPRGSLRVHFEMTTNVMRRKKADAAIEDEKAASSGVAIGEMETGVFTCPACARPLSEGTSRCPGCGTLLLLGVAVRKAGAILALGLALGFLFGGVITATVISLTAHEASAPAVVATAPAPIVTAAPGAVASSSVLRRRPSRP